MFLLFYSSSFHMKVTTEMSKVFFSVTYNSNKLLFTIRHNSVSDVKDYQANGCIQNRTLTPPYLTSPSKLEMLLAQFIDPVIFTEGNSIQMSIIIVTYPEKLSTQIPLRIVYTRKSQGKCTLNLSLIKLNQVNNLCSSILYYLFPILF